MTDDRSRDDAASWFAAQFGSHDDPDDSADAAGAADEALDAAEAGDTAKADGVVGPAAEPTSGDAAGPAGGLPSWSPALPEGTVAPEPAVSASGGFNWGLTPTNAAPSAPSVVPVPSEPAAGPVAPPESTASPESTAPPESTTPLASVLQPAPEAPLPSMFAPPLPVQPEPLPPATSVFAPPSVAAPSAAPPPLVVPPVAPPVELPVAAQGEPQPFDAALAGGPSIETEPPTVALPWEGPATELFAPPVASASVAEPATELLGGFGPGADAAAASPVDALFGESQFREYQTGSLATAKPAPERVPRAPIPRSQRVLFWIAGSLAALLVLVGLFFLGTKLPRSSGAPAAATMPSASAKPSPSPTPTVLPVGPLAVGSYKWDRLLGGECLDPFTSPWAEKFTVVDCGAPHPAQLVARGVFAATPLAATDPSAQATPAVGGPTSAYPGAEALQAQINLLCTTPGVIDFAAAGAYDDIQILGSYPATAKQWADGERSYFCFVTRSSGQPITGSVAVPKAP